ncbi:MAG: N-acetylmuramoyl-L-alanine amidase [Sedimentisphaerales bacterium]|nr:N-acetylmuramoyl-L-alanine amidase [Sedimentisphaerales bacterium]
MTDAGWGHNSLSSLLFRDDVLKFAVITIRDVDMPNQARVVKVLAMLLASMTIGAIVLMTMGHNPPSAGPFSLWSFYRLPPIRDVICSKTSQLRDRWNWIEIYYSGTNSGNIEQLAAINGLSNSQDINCHFCIYNGFGGNDGQIQPTEKWQKQQSAPGSNKWNGSEQAVRICVVADGRNTRPTDCQIKRIQILVEELCRTFNIKPESVFYPNDWR